MGYRSDVSIVFYVRGMDTDPTAGAALKFWFDETYPVKEATDEWCAIIRHKDGAIIVDYEDVKWYNGYEHPKQVDAALRKFTDTFNCEEDTTEFAWEVIRIGEDDTDIEVDRSEYSDALLYVSRAIRVDLVGID